MTTLTKEQGDILRLFHATSEPRVVRLRGDSYDYWHAPLPTMCGGMRLSVAPTTRAPNLAYPPYNYSPWNHHMKGIFYIFQGHVPEPAKNAAAAQVVQEIVDALVALAEPGDVTYGTVEATIGNQPHTLWMVHKFDTKLLARTMGPRTHWCHACDVEVPGGGRCPMCGAYAYTSGCCIDNKPADKSRSRYMRTRLPINRSLSWGLAAELFACNLRRTPVIYWPTDPLHYLLTTLAESRLLLGDTNVAILTSDMPNAYARRKLYRPHLTNRAMMLLWKHRDKLPEYGLELHAPPQPATNPREHSHIIDSMVIRCVDRIKFLSALASPVLGQAESREVQQ